MSVNKEIHETVLKILNLYAFSMALSSVNIKDISELKIQKQDVKNELVNLHYRMVEKESVENSRVHSAKLFRVLYADIKKEHSRNFT